MVFHNSKGQMIGNLKDGIFRKVVRGSKHLLKIRNAWGLDSEVVGQLEGQCKEIRIKDSETGTVFKTSFENFKEHCFEMDFVGKQTFLEKRYFTV